MNPSKEMIIESYKTIKQLINLNGPEYFMREIIPKISKITEIDIEIILDLLDEFKSIIYPVKISEEVEFLINRSKEFENCEYKDDLEEISMRLERLKTQTKEVEKDKDESNTIEFTGDSVEIIERNIGKFTDLTTPNDRKTLLNSIVEFLFKFIHIKAKTIINMLIGIATQLDCTILDRLITNYQDRADYKIELQIIRNKLIKSNILYTKKCLEHGCKCNEQIIDHGLKDDLLKFSCYNFSSTIFYMRNAVNHLKTEINYDIFHKVISIARKYPSAFFTHIGKLQTADSTAGLIFIPEYDKIIWEIIYEFYEDLGLRRHIYVFLPKFNSVFTSMVIKDITMTDFTQMSLFSKFSLDDRRKVELYICCNEIYGPSLCLAKCITDICRIISSKVRYDEDTNMSSVDIRDVSCELQDQVGSKDNDIRDVSVDELQDNNNALEDTILISDEQDSRKFESEVAVNEMINQELKLSDLVENQYSNLSWEEIAQKIECYILSYLADPELVGCIANQIRDIYEYLTDVTRLEIMKSLLKTGKWRNKVDFIKQMSEIRDALAEEEMLVIKGLQNDRVYYVRETYKVLFCRDKVGLF